MYPEKQTLLDYRFDGKENWWSWLKSETVPIPPDMLVSEIMVPTKETGFIMNWLEMCANLSLPIILVGPTGTGKSATIMNYLSDLPKDKFILNVVNFSARTTAQQVQELIMTKLDRRRKGLFGPSVGKSVGVFIMSLYACKNLYPHKFHFSARYLSMMLQCLLVMHMDHSRH